MRRIICCMMLTLLLCGCAEQSNVEPAVDAVGADTISEDYTSAEPPCMLFFDSLEELYTLFSSVNWSNEEFQAFTSKTPSRSPYSKNGIDTKEDVLYLKDMLSAVPFPIVSDAELFNFIITPDYDTFNLSYEIRPENGSSVNRILSFRIYYNDEAVDTEWSRRPQGETYFTVSSAHEASGTLWLSGVLQGHRVVYAYKETTDSSNIKTAEEILSMEPNAQKVLKEQVKMVPLVWYLENKLPEPEEWKTQTLRFNNLEEMGQFFKSVELDNTFFLEYIQDFGAEFQWIQSKEDILALINQLSNVPFPLLSNAEMKEISFRCDIEKLHIVYAPHCDEAYFLDFDVYYGYWDKDTKNTSINFKSTGEHKTTGMLSARALIDGYEVKYTYRPAHALTAKELLLKKSVIDEMLQKELSIVTVLHAPDTTSS